MGAAARLRAPHHTPARAATAARHTCAPHARAEHVLAERAPAEHGSGPRYAAARELGSWTRLASRARGDPAPRVHVAAPRFLVGAACFRFAVLGEPFLHSATPFLDPAAP